MAFSNGAEGSTSPASGQASSPTHHPPTSASPQSHQHPPHTHSLAAAAAMNAGLQNEERRASQTDTTAHNLASSPQNNYNGSTRNSTTLSSTPAEPINIERRRRRSSIRHNLTLNDPAIPGPGELQQTVHPGVSPIFSSSATRSVSGTASQHSRAPSLGEIHQELEAEGEAQVNRLLAQIRQEQQAQNAAAASQHQHQQSGEEHSAAAAITTPTSARSGSFPVAASPTSHPVLPRTSSPVPVSARLSRHSSSSRSRVRGSPRLVPGGSQSHSPALAAGSSHVVDGGAGDFSTLPASATTSSLSSSPVASRDESAFYQAETQMLVRENQMLKHRIRELEAQMADRGSGGASSMTTTTTSPLALGDGKEGV